MIRRLFLLFISLATGSLVTAFVLSRTNNGILASLVVGLAWVTLELFDRRWAASLGLFAFVIMAVVGAMQEYYAVFHALAVVAALSAWDLSRYGYRLKLLGESGGWVDATRNHVRRLLLVNGVGLLLALGAISLQLGGSFALQWVLALLALGALFVLVLRMAKLTQ